VTGPIPVRALLARPAEPTAGAAGRWSLVGSDGLWCTDCLVPGCGWTNTTTTSDAATTAAVLHALTHPHHPASTSAQIRSTL
jgi:hypothetical protein